jgi:hypothetical protein
MNTTNSKVYVEFIDAAGYYFPIEASFVSENVYQLLPNDEFDYDDDVLFAFGSQDTVRVKQLIENEKHFPTAYELIKVGDPRNLQKRLLISILYKKPEPQELLEGVSESEIKSLCKKLEDTDFMYPAIKDWYILHKDKIQSLINE